MKCLYDTTGSKKEHFPDVREGNSRFRESFSEVYAVESRTTVMPAGGRLRRTAIRSLRHFVRPERNSSGSVQPSFDLTVTPASIFGTRRGDGIYIETFFEEK